MLSLRTISMVKNLKVLTATFGFLEAIIYIFGLAIVLSGEQSYLEMVVYAIGFSLGLIAGIIIEQKLSIGYSSFHVNINHENPILVKELREKGYGVTTYVGEGRTSQRLMLDILIKRKHEEELVSMILKYEPAAFIISYEPKMFKGGYLSDIMRQRATMLRKMKNRYSESPNFIEKSVKEIKMEVHKFKKDWKPKK
jgi:uncharacterized protein YebE (UPF0316 family)